MVKQLLCSSAEGAEERIRSNPDFPLFYGTPAKAKKKALKRTFQSLVRETGLEPA